MLARAFLEFVWLPTFERTAAGLLDENDRRELELALIENPRRGDTMPRTGGFRKMRWAAKGKGKRGGARVVYFVVADRKTIYMVLAYGKGERQDLSKPQRAELKKLPGIIEEDRT